MRTAALVAAAAAASLSVAAGASANSSGVVFAWGGVDKHDDPRIYQGYDWNTITHLGFFGKLAPGMTTLAKQHGVKLIPAIHMPDHQDWPSASKRAAWIQQYVPEVKQSGWDGMSFDFEGNMLSSAEQEGYVSLVRETKAALVAALGPDAYLNVCVGGRPSYEWRNYNYSGLVEAGADHLFIMAYDLITYDDYTCVTIGTCSLAEAGMPDVEAGVSAYVKAVDGHADRLILGLPWYGATYMRVVGVPFFVGQIPYGDVVDLLANHSDWKPQYDDKQLTWHVECKGQSSCRDGHKGSEMWWDDPTSLAAKFALAKKNNFGGVGMWNAKQLPYVTQPDKAAAMWKTIAAWNS